MRFNRVFLLLSLFVFASAILFLNFGLCEEIQPTNGDADSLDKDDEVLFEFKPSVGTKYCLTRESYANLEEAESKKYVWREVIEYTLEVLSKNMQTQTFLLRVTFERFYKEVPHENSPEVKFDTNGTETQKTGAPEYYKILVGRVYGLEVSSTGEILSVDGIDDSIDDPEFTEASLRSNFTLFWIYSPQKVLRKKGDSWRIDHYPFVLGDTVKGEATFTFAGRENGNPKLEFSDEVRPQSIEFLWAKGMVTRGQCASHRKGTAIVDEETGFIISRQFSHKESWNGETEMEDGGSVISNSELTSEVKLNMRRCPR